MRRLEVGSRDRLGLISNNELICAGCNPILAAPAGPNRWPDLACTCRLLLPEIPHSHPQRLRIYDRAVKLERPTACKMQLQLPLDFCFLPSGVRRLQLIAFLRRGLVLLLHLNCRAFLRRGRAGLASGILGGAEQLRRHRHKVLNETVDDERQQ